MSNQMAIPAGLPALSPGQPARNAELGQVQAPKPVPLFVNPSFQFDPSVGLVVIQFHDDKGTVNDSIPSPRQLAAYRDHQATPPGEHAPQATHAKTSAG
jgi:hypothetical protein